MSFEALVEEVRQFERSSGYRYGDRSSFSVSLYEGLLLKGPVSAGSYLDMLKLEKLPARVMVVNPGNGGLVTECYKRGAKRVIAVETRHRFQATLRRVLKLQERIWRAKKVKGLSYRLVERWQQVLDNDGFRDVDLILWPEGLDEITRPKEIFRTLKTALNAGGRLMVEVRHGRHNWVEEINSWQPSEHAIAEMSQEIFGGKWADKIVGRGGQTSGIFTLVKQGEKKAPVKKKKTPAKKAPKKKPAPKPAPEPEKAVEKPVEVAPAPPVAPKALVKKAKKKKKKKVKKAAKKTKEEPAGQEKSAKE